MDHEHQVIWNWAFEIYGLDDEERQIYMDAIMTKPKGDMLDYIERELHLDTKHLQSCITQASKRYMLEAQNYEENK